MRSFKNQRNGSTHPTPLGLLFHDFAPASNRTASPENDSQDPVTVPVLVSAFLTLAVLRLIFAVFYIITALLHCGLSWSEGSCEPSNFGEHAAGFAIQKMSSVFIWIIFYSCISQICFNVLFLLFSKLGCFCSSDSSVENENCDATANFATLVALTMNEVELLLLVILQRLWRQSTYNLVASRSLNTVSFVGPQQRVNLWAFV